MRQQRRALSLFLIIALLLNLFLPMSLVSAANGADGVVDCTSVTDDAYAKEPEPCTEEEQQELPSVGLLDEIELVAASQEIVENIITDVKIYANPDNEGNPLDNPPIEIQNIRPEVGDPVSVHYVWELEGDHSYSEGDTFTFELPNNFAPGLTLDGPLYGENNEYVADFKVEGNEVVFTFTDAIKWW